MPLPAALIMGGVKLLGGLFKGLTGRSQRKQGNKLLAENPYPEAKVQSAFTENKDLATQMAKEGMPSEQYNKAMRNIQRQQIGALRGANDRRGGLMAISGLQQGTNDALLNLAAKDAEMRNANQRNLINVNNQYGNQQNRVWDWNVRNKYQQNRNYAMSLLGAGNANKVAGVDSAISGAGYLGSTLFGNNTANQYADMNRPIAYGGGVGGDPNGGNLRLDEYGNVLN